VHDRTYSSLLQYSRRRFFSYLDSALWILASGKDVWEQDHKL
jgi:hypothetical protein